jgi:hypothetical protein
MATTLRQYVDQQQKFNSLMAQSDPDASADEVDGKQKKVFKNRHPEHGQFQSMSQSGADETGASHRMYKSPKGDILHVEHGAEGSSVSLHPHGNMSKGKKWNFGNKFDAEQFKVTNFGKTSKAKKNSSDASAS